MARLRHNSGLPSQKMEGVPRPGETQGSTERAKPPQSLRRLSVVDRLASRSSQLQGRALSALKHQVDPVLPTTLVAAGKGPGHLLKPVHQGCVLPVSGLGTLRYLPVALNGTGTTNSPNTVRTAPLEDARTTLIDQVLVVSRVLFAGSLKACRLLAGRPPGLFARGRRTNALGLLRKLVLA